mgnify:CR=1 FL=1
MKIGIIGDNKSINEILKDGQNFSLSGYYISEKTSTDSILPGKTQKYTSPQDLIKESDILYINQNEEAFEIAEQGIKTSTNIFFESPFILSESKFNELFDLADETNVLIKFNQRILQEDVYSKINGTTAPDIIKTRIDSAEINPENTSVQKAIFKFASIVRDNIKSRIRKIHTYKDEQTNKYFSLNIQLDNDSHCELLFNSITHEDAFYLDFFYPNKLIHVDFPKNKIKFTSQKNTTTNDATPKQDLTKKELDHFISILPKLSSMPVNIREENQYLLYLTYRLLEKVLPGEG